MFNTLIYSLCMPELYVSCVLPRFFPAFPGERERLGRPATRHPAPAGEINEGEKRRVTSSRRRLKTKALHQMNLLSTHPLKADVVFCLLNPPLLPHVTDPSPLFLVPQGPAAPAKPAAPETSPPTPGCQTWLDPASSAHDHRRHFHITIGLLFTDPLSQKDEVSTFCQWPREGAGTPCRWLE